MDDFIFHNPDKVYFGKKVLLVYGGGSINKNGLYDSVVTIAKDSGIEMFELPGVEPNPRHSTVNKGAAICKQEHIDVIFAVDGMITGPTELRPADVEKIYEMCL